MIGALLSLALLFAGPADADVEWFQKTEQALMDAVAAGDKATWEGVLDDSFMMTSEEGQVTTKEHLLKDLRPLPKGLTGSIAVRELTVQQMPGFAVVRYLADETETVFGQGMSVKYRATDTFRRADAGWKMVASHVSVVTSDPPAQKVDMRSWPDLVGDYQLRPDGWIFHVVLRNGQLYGGRSRANLRLLIPLAPEAFVAEGSLGEWIFVRGESGKTSHVVNLRKFAPLVWTKTS